jgi:hypothetical protein
VNAPHHVPTAEARKLAHRTPAELRAQAARFDAIDARLRRVPDAHRSDLLATLPTATAAMLAVILPMLGITVVFVVIGLQVTLWAPVAYKVIRKL